jgi:hypothetical protein
MSHLANIEPGLRIPIPPEWADALGDKPVVSLERTEAGILIRPCPTFKPTLTWVEFFANKLPIGSGQRADADEVRDSDYLF